MINNLFFDTKKHSYVLVAPVNCFTCEENIKDVAIIYSCFSKNNSFCRIYCRECQAKINIDYLSIVKSILFSRMVLNVKEHFIPISLQPPDLVDSRNPKTGLSTGVWEASHVKNEGVKIIDNAIVSRDPNRNKQIDANNKSDIKLSLEIKDKNLILEEADDYLLSLMNSQPVIESDEKKLLDKS